MAATDSMTTREIEVYLAKRQQLGWPGSLSIHPMGRKPKQEKKSNG